MEMVAAAASDDEAGVDRRALADEGLETRVEPAGSGARAPHEIGQTPEEVLRVRIAPLLAACFTTCVLGDCPGGHDDSGS